MGSGGSTAVVEKIESCSVDDIRDAINALPDDTIMRLKNVLHKEAQEPEAQPIELKFVLDELFKCYDSDEDGQIEREEFLVCCEKIASILDESFGPKQRKKKMTWFKESGAEGSVETGMYLTREKWQVSLVNTASSEADIATDDEPKLAAWIWNSYGKKLANLCFPGSHPDPPENQDVSSGEGPQYPVRIPLTELANKIEEATRQGLRPLVFGNKLDEVGTYFKYTMDDCRTFDSSKLFMMKATEKRDLIKMGTDFGGNCYPLYLKLSSGAPDIAKNVGDDFPAEIFDGTMWTPEVAFAQGFISQSLWSKVELQPEMWKLFTIVLHSDLGLEEGLEQLRDKIPYFDKLAVLEIDPDSVVKES
eukprot:TRINITY_DN30322_c0_g1_i1.p1 TRINITY_DN30322_c0_g1~~TRINITY_DN30322_c0_g1_i1.p1  ORF type:complete len:377 (+),score=38.64 TRINITY_DN30322_c0_g1_i1:48-1133(+)